MKLRVLAPTLAVVLSFSACKDDKKKDGNGNVTTTGNDIAKKVLGDAVSASGAPAPDTAKTNAIWSLAPADTKLGIVVAPGAGTELHSMMMGAIETAETRPLGLKILSEMRNEAANNDPFNPLDTASIKAAGFDLAGGVGIFMTEKKRGYMVLPISDREAFRKVTEGTLETIDGVEVDKHDDDLFCFSKNDLYVCSTKSVDDLKSFGEKVDGPLAQRVAALPMEYRGQAEFVIDVAAMKDIDPDFDTDFEGQMSDPELGVGSLRFGNGAVTLRGWFQVKALDKVAAAAAVSNSLSAGLASVKPAGIFSFRLPMQLMADELPPGGKQFAGLDLRKDVVGNLTGEFVGYAPQSDGLWGRVDIGIRDPGPFKTLLNMACGMAPAAGIPGVEVTPADGKCTAMIDVAKLPLPDPSLGEMFDKPISIVAEVKADRIETTFGDVGPTHGKPVSALGQELIGKKWNFSVWSEGIQLAAGGNGIPWNNMPKEVTGEVLDGIKLAVWMLSHVYEVGMAGGIRDDGIHGVLHIGTYAGDAPETFKAYQAAVSTVLSTGQATEDFAAIREKWPNSMAARGTNGAGSMLIAGVTGVFAAVGIPAYFKYQQKSMEALEVLETPQR